MEKVIEVHNLHKSFKRHFWSSHTEVLKGLSFSTPKASATGFLGANGSGKTTTFKCLLELIKKDQGQALFFGEPLSLKNRSRIGFLPERPQFYEELTAEESLRFYVALRMPLSDSLNLKIEQGLKKMGLYAWKNKKLRTFSKGMLQKVGILQSLVHDPDLLIMDEPFSGLDPESRFLVSELLEERLKGGCTLFLSSHIFQDIERLCDRLLIIKEGGLVFEGGFSELGFSHSGKKNIIYLFKGEKKTLSVLNQEDCQKELKRLVSQGAVVLSLESEGTRLEEKYKELINKGSK